MTYAAEVIADSPLAYWKLEEASGAFVDATAGARDLTAAPGSPPGAITYEVDGMVPSSKGARFQNGATATRAHDVSLRLEGSFGIEFWLRVGNTAVTFPSVLRKGNGTGNGSWLVYLNNQFGGNHVAFKRDNQDRNSGTGTPPGTVSVGQPTHIGIDYDASASELRWILNGKVILLNSAVTFATGTADTSIVEVFSETGSDHLFDEIALYDHSVTPTRWLEHFNAGAEPELRSPRANFADYEQIGPLR